MSRNPSPSDPTAYPKIPAPFLRDPATNRLTTDWSSPELEATADVPWRFTEKVDGTNLRVIWDGYRVTFGGRTERAQLHVAMHAWLQERFGGAEREQLFEQKFGETPVVLYGEGYGAGIQNGGAYRPDMAMVLFDILVDGSWWLQEDDVAEVSRYFGIGRVPVVARRTLREQIHLLRFSPVLSTWGNFPAEGLVGVTDAGLRGRDGRRLIVKLKYRDLGEVRA